MYEARIKLENSNRDYVIVAGNVDMLKKKCARYIESDLAYEIYVVKVEEVGFLKCRFSTKLL